MRWGMSDMARGNKGQILLLALLVMFVGAIILAGLFQYLGSSLLLATKGEENAVNYYAADSGIEDALYGLRNNQEYEYKEYTLNYTNSTANNRVVTVNLSNDPYDWGNSIGNTTYKITSTATHNKSGVSTIIESYIRATPLEFMRWDDAAITSNCSVELQKGTPGSVINGSVNYVCTLNCGGDPDCPLDAYPPASHDCCENKVVGGSDNITAYPDGIDWWPERRAITKYFKDQVDPLNPFIDVDAKNTINAEDFPTLGPIFRDGDLNIEDSNCKPPDICPRRITLTGTVFVTGHLTMGGAKDFILDLNGQVIFVEYDGEKPDEAIVIDDDCHIEGSGAIISVGSINALPSMQTEPTDFVLFMSVQGGITLHPNGDFYGAINGHDYVDVSPNNDITQVDGDSFWDTLPDTDVNIINILTYDIVDR